MNVVYTDQPNKLRIMVDGLPCNSMYVMASEGTIAGRDCRYIFTPAKIGAVELKIANVATKNKPLETFTLRAKPLPDGVLQLGHPTILLTDSEKGYITRSTLLSTSAPFVSASYNYSGVGYTLSQYKLSVVSARGVVLYRKNYTGNDLNFDAVAKGVFAYLHHDDVVQISDIVCKRSDGEAIEIPNLIMKVSH